MGSALSSFRVGLISASVTLAFLVVLLVGGGGSAASEAFFGQYGPLILASAAWLMMLLAVVLSVRARGVDAVASTAHANRTQPPSTATPSSHVVTRPPSAVPHRAAFATDAVQNAGGAVRHRRRAWIRFSIATLAVGIAVATGSTNALAATPQIFVVNSTADQADINPGDGVCSTGSFGGNKCTLRAAILESNAHSAADVIEFSVSGPFALGIPVVNDDTPATGDFDLLAPVTFRGGIGTVIDGGTPPENNADAIVWIGSSRSIRARATLRSKT